jgi:hypothetical protein
MRKMSKRSSAIVASAVAVGAVAAGTIAYAAFQRVEAANAGPQGAEKFHSLTVSAQWIGVRPSHAGGPISTRLLPGDTADVAIQVQNHADNTVNGKITSITPDSIGIADITGVADADREYCKNALTVRSFSPPNFVVGASGDTHTLDLRDAVALHPDTDIKCSNMSFPLNYKITIAATRNVVAKPAYLAP